MICLKNLTRFNFFFSDLVLKKRKILDNETLGKLDENVFVFEKPSDISLSIEYSEQGLSEVCESMRTKEMVSLYLRHLFTLNLHLPSFFYYL